jgi:hypothetical protein
MQPPHASMPMPNPFAASPSVHSPFLSSLPSGGFAHGIVPHHHHHHGEDDGATLHDADHLSWIHDLTAASEVPISPSAFDLASHHLMPPPHSLPPHFQQSAPFTQPSFGNMVESAMAATATEPAVFGSWAQEHQQHHDQHQQLPPDWNGSAFPTLSAATFVGTSFAPSPAELGPSLAGAFALPSSHEPSTAAVTNFAPGADASKPRGSFNFLSQFRS